MHLTQGEMRAFLDNEVQDRDRVARHLEGCSQCREILRSTQERMQFMLRAFSCANRGMETSGSTPALAYAEFENRKSERPLLWHRVTRSAPHSAWVSLFLCVLLGAGLGVQHVRKANREDDRSAAKTSRPPTGRHMNPGNGTGRHNGPSGNSDAGTGHSAFQPPLIGQPGRFESGPQKAPTAQLSRLKLFGRVVTASGEPVPGVPLIACEPPQSPLFGPPGPTIATVHSDRNGRYEMLLEVWPDRRIAVLPSHPGFIAYRDNIVVKSGGDFARDYVLWEEQSTVKGRVLDDANQPLAGAEIRLLVAEPSGDRINDTEVASAHPGLYRRTFSDPDGSYAIPGLPSGHLGSAFVLADAHLGEIRGESLQPGENIWNFRLRGGEVVEFVVKSEQGRPIRSATATVWAEGGSLPSVNVRESEGDGKIRLTLAPGTLPFRCSVFGNGFLRQEIPIDPKKPPREVILTEGLLVRGIVVSEEGEPIPGATVALVRQEAFDRKDGASHMTNTPEGESLESDIQGRFEHRFSVLPDDRFSYSVMAAHPAYLKVDGAVFREEILSGFFTLELPKPAGEIQGQVIDWQGKPVGEFNVSIAPAAREPLPDPTKILELTRRRRAFSHYSHVSDPQGRFSVSQVPAGDLRVSVFGGPGSGWGSADVRVVEGQPPQALIIRLGQPPVLP